MIGAITGIPLGAVQVFLLCDRVARSWVWAAAMPLLWAQGWTVTAAAGVGVDRQYAVFGAFGAVTVMALPEGRRDRIAVRCGTDGQSADRERRISGGFVRSLPRSRWELTVDAA